MLFWVFWPKRHTLNATSLACPFLSLGCAFRRQKGTGARPLVPEAAASRGLATLAVRPGCGNWRETERWWQAPAAAPHMQTVLFKGSGTLQSCDAIQTYPFANTKRLQHKKVHKTSQTQVKNDLLENLHPMMH